MTAKQVLLNGMTFSFDMMKRVLDDLTDADLLVRPVPGGNHIAWQLGHLISAEHRLMTSLGLGKMPDLPDGFSHHHNKAAAASDDPATFGTKETYLKLYAEQRAASRALLENFDDARLEEKVSERGMPPFLKTVADVFYLLGSHQIMHSGQFSTTRRKLGKPVVI